MQLQRFTVTYFEAAPWQHGSRLDPADGTFYDVDELINEVTNLPEVFLVALNDLHVLKDNARCDRCGDLVGFVLEDNGDFERLSWTPTGLVQESDGPVVAQCEECTPYVEVKS